MAERGAVEWGVVVTAVETMRLTMERRLGEQAAMLERLRTVAVAARSYVPCVQACHDCCNNEGYALADALTALQSGDLGEDV